MLHLKIFIPYKLVCAVQFFINLKHHITEIPPGMQCVEFMEICNSMPHYTIQLFFGKQLLLECHHSTPNIRLGEKDSGTTRLRRNALRIHRLSRKDSGHHFFRIRPSRVQAEVLIMGFDIVDECRFDLVSEGTLKHLFCGKEVSLTIVPQKT